MSWLAYWAGLAAVTLGPGILAGWRASQGPDGTGDITVGFVNDALKVTVAQFGQTTWTLTAPILTLAVWLAGPPLLIWGIWLSRAAQSRLRDANAPAELGTGAAFTEAPEGREGSPVSRSTR
jgi:hypothetical protein